MHTDIMNYKRNIVQRKQIWKYGKTEHSWPYSVEGI